MPISYLGSKKKSAKIIYKTIIELSPKFDTIVDLFCGGFAIGEIFAQKSTLCGGTQKHSNQPTEKLFVYKENQLENLKLL